MSALQLATSVNRSLSRLQRVSELPAKIPVETEAAAPPHRPGRPAPDEEETGCCPPGRLGGGANEFALIRALSIAATWE